MSMTPEQEAFLKGESAAADTKQAAPVATFTGLTEESSVDNFSLEDVQPLAGEQFQRLEIFDSGADISAMFDEDILQERKHLYPWQTEVNETIAQHEGTTKNPLKYCLVAANGSGKDAYVIAPTVLFFALRYIKSNIIITSASGVQLTNQTETYIRSLAHAINNKFGEKWFKINQRNIICHKTGSIIRMFATDEPGKAEGYHPLPGGDGKCVLILNECKSISEDIIKATKRCTTTHLLYISSAGEPKGAFYFAYNNWRNKKRITSYECPHKTLEQIQEDALEYGEHSAWFRSKHLSLFTSVDAQVIVTQENVNKCLELCPAWIGHTWPKRVGLDLSAGGDETVICITQGNKRIYQYTFREKDTTIAADIISKKLTEQGIAKDSEYIRADNGGVGVGIIDNLKRMGWNIKRVHNQWAARNKVEFGNIGAEMWFKVNRLVEKNLLLLPKDDQRFMDQLTARHYKQKEKGKTFLLPKSEEKADGHPSPDRVDAYILSLFDLTLQDFLDADAPRKEVQKTAASIVSQEQIVEGMKADRDQAYVRYQSGLSSEQHEALYDKALLDHLVGNQTNSGKKSAISNYSLDDLLNN